METIGATDLGTRTAELLERLARGEAFEVAVDGHAIGRLTPTGADATPPTAATSAGNDAGPSLKELILNGPSLEGLSLHRDRSAVRGVDL